MESHRIRCAVDSRAVAFGAHTNLHILAEVENMPHIPQFLHNRDDSAFRSAGRTVQHSILLRLFEFIPRRIQRKMHLVCNIAQITATEVAKNQIAIVFLDSRNATVLNGLRLVGDNQIQVELITLPHALTGGAAALRIVKTEESRFQFRNRNAALRACQERTLQAIFIIQ